MTQRVITHLHIGASLGQSDSIEMSKIMSKTNTRLMKLFWLIEDGANAEAIMAFLGKTGRSDWKSRPQKTEDRPRDERRAEPQK